MTPSDMFLLMRNEVTELTDQNGDNKIDRKDLDILIGRAEARAEYFMQKRSPLKGLSIAFACGSLFAGLLAFTLRVGANDVGPNEIRAHCEQGYCVVPEPDLRKLLKNNDAAVSNSRALHKLLEACKTARQT